MIHTHASHKWWTLYHHFYHYLQSEKSFLEFVLLHHLNSFFSSVFVQGVSPQHLERCGLSHHHSHIVLVNKIHEGELVKLARLTELGE